MSEKDDGGPAFPGGDGPNCVGSDSGMSLRDWFAGQAMAGLLGDGGSDFKTVTETAKHAYDLADAMLEARKS